MKLEFKFGYIHMLRWLVRFKLEDSNSLNKAPWNIMAASYRSYWESVVHHTNFLDRPAAEEIINSLRKL